MMAWLGTALKSSQPSRSASRKSDRPMVRMIGAAAMSCAGGASGVTLSDVVAMVVSPLQGRADAGHKRTVCEIDHDQARREDRKPKRAASRTESAAYSQSLSLPLTLQ